MGSHEDYLKERICLICKMTLLEPHPEKPHLYLKCKTCGYTKEIKK